MSIMVTEKTIEDAREQFEKTLQLEEKQEARGFLYGHVKPAFKVDMVPKKQREAQVERLVKDKDLSRYEGILNQLAPNLRNFTVPFHLANELILSIPKYEKRKAKIAEMERMKAAVRMQKEKEKEKEEGKIAKSELAQAVANAIKGIKIEAVPLKSCIKKASASKKKKNREVRFAEHPKFNAFYDEAGTAA